MTFDSARKPELGNRRRVGMVLHEGFTLDSVGATALKPDAAVTALMADDGELYVEAHGKIFHATPDGMVEVNELPKRVRADLNDAKQIYADRVNSSG